jgi:hypothetical protein
MEKISERRRTEAVDELKKVWGENYVANSEQATRAYLAGGVVTQSPLPSGVAAIA